MAKKDPAWSAWAGLDMQVHPNSVAMLWCMVGAKGLRSLWP
jgi:hypothetical protein